jgi:hypothetical protein
MTPEIETPATPTETPATPAPVQPDLDARLLQIEAALKAPAAKPAETKPTETAVPTYQDLLAQGKRAEAIVALLGDQADDDVLLELAPLLDGRARREPTVEEIVDAKLAAKEAAAEKARQDAAKAAEDAEIAEGQAQVDAYMVRGAQAQQAGIEAGKYPFIKVYGVDPSRFQSLMFEAIERDKAIPDPDTLLAKIEAEHYAQWSKSPLAQKPAEDPEDVDARIRQTFRNQASKVPPPAYQPRPDDDEDPARAYIRRLDHEAAIRRNWR